ncbi:M16 family metallopeptidase [Tundrisphaera lichenicola]|uniref:M16 family metallopeptidase n=1 Tax=Tundrisphaera lichenicola TaxID=2029860 RepID=UPI003EB8161B
MPMFVIAQDVSLPKIPIESYTLPNGLKVVLHRDPGVPRVTVCMAYHVGSKNERAKRTGFAHFFEHMMFRGTKNVPNYDIPLQETGAQSNAFTSEDMTVYFETVPTSFLDRALYLEAERLAFLPSALDQDKFDTEREVVKNERRQSYENVPYGLSEETILANVFPKGHPYSWSVIGSMKDLDAASIDDLRQFFGEFYHPGNAAICLAGDFDIEAAKASILKYFGPIPAGKAIEAVEAPTPRLTKSVGLAATDKVSLPRLYWSWPVVADDHPDAPALHLLASILSEGEASRLNRSLIKEARVANEVDATSDTKEVSGLFTIDATAAEGKSIEELTRALEASMADLKANPPTNPELARALAKFEQQTFNSLTAPLGRAIMLAVDYVQKGDPAAYFKDYARYYKVTTDDLSRVAETYLTPEKVVLTISPGESKSEGVQSGPLPGPSPVESRQKQTPDGPVWQTLPGPAQPSDWHPPRYVRKTLSNGTELWAVPWQTLPIVEARLIIPVGTADDPAGKSGLAALTGSLLDKGTKTRTDTQLAEDLDALGVSLSVGTSADSTSMGLSVLSRNLKPALSLVGQILTEPRFDPVDFDRERKLQLDGLLQGPDSPSWIARRAFQSLLYGANHPYGNPGQGFVTSVKSLTVEDVRAFHARFAANRSILIVVGDFDPDALIQDLESTLGAWKTTGPEPAERPAFKALPQPGVVYLADKPGAVQSVIAVGRRWFDRKDPRYFASLIGNHIVGDDFLSRLNANLREKNGYTYGCGSSFGYQRTGGSWQVRTSVRSDVTAESLKEILGELDALDKARPLDEEEITTAREAEIRTFPESFEDPGSISGVLGSLALYDLPGDYLETYLKELRNCPDELIRRTMIEVVAPTDRAILIVGDRKSVEPRLKELGFRDIRPVDPDGKPVKP